MKRRAVIKTIEDAFRGTKLEDGVSLRQTEVLDRYGEGSTHEKYLSLPKSEIIDDWQRIPASELDRAECLAHLDAKGFRYYIPALMIRLLEDYDPSSMRTIGTLDPLYPR